MGKEVNDFYDFEALLRAAYAETPLESYREKYREPRDIKHVILDADDTLWQVNPGYLASNCTAPYHKISDESLFCANAWSPSGEENIVTLNPGALDILKELKSKGIGVSVVSHNPKNSVQRIIDNLGLSDDFDTVVEDWQNKGKLVKKLVKKKKLDPEEVIFVDDDLGNVINVNNWAGVMSLCYDIDIQDLRDILEFIK